MALISFADLPETSRLWIFASPAEVPESQVVQFLKEVATAIHLWQAHGKDLSAGFAFRYKQFVFIAANENVEMPSGCSIDTLTHEIDRIGKLHGASFLAPGLVFYRVGDNIHSVTRAEFKSLVESGTVSADTVVFNNALTRLSELRAGKWEVAAKDSWHAQAFKFPVAA